MFILANNNNNVKIFYTSPLLSSFFVPRIVNSQSQQNKNLKIFIIFHVLFAYVTIIKKVTITFLPAPFPPILNPGFLSPTIVFEMWISKDRRPVWKKK